MEKFLETTGKTIDEAIAAALAELGMDRDSVSVEVLEKPKSGFLGIGGTPARIRVTYEQPEASPRPAPPPAVSSPVSAPRRAPEAPRPSFAPAPVPAEKPRKAPAPASERAAYGVSFVEGLATRMGIADARVSVEETEDSMTFDIIGTDMGPLIGRRGETLDAVQRVVASAVNRRLENPVRVTVDTEGYRVKREESLISLAKKTAECAVKYRKNIALEPMNSYSRHVVHTALQDFEGVTTHSVGTDPQRRVIISVPGGTDERPRRPSSNGSRPAPGEGYQRRPAPSGDGARRPGGAYGGGYANRSGDRNGDTRPPYRGPKK